MLAYLGSLCSGTILINFLQLTGRVEPKRRWSDGIHQAVEAKEGLKIQVIIKLPLPIYTTGTIYKITSISFVIVCESV
jgi:hypothetical protein